MCEGEVVPQSQCRFTVPSWGVTGMRDGIDDEIDNACGGGQ